MVYHVRITLKSSMTDSIELDLSKKDLISRIVDQYHSNTPFHCGGDVIIPDSVRSIRINSTKEKSDQLIPLIKQERETRRVLTPSISDEWYVTTKGIDVTSDFIKHTPINKQKVILKETNHAQEATAHTITEINTPIGKAVYILNEIFLALGLKANNFLKYVLISAVLTFLYFKPNNILPLAGLAGVLAILALLKDNKVWTKIPPIKNIIHSLKRKTKIDNFLKEIDHKSFNEVIDFLYKYKGCLVAKNIKIIIKLKHTNTSLFKHILQTQTINQELIEYLVEDDLLENVQPEVLNKFILECDTLDRNSIKKIMDKYSGDTLVLSSLFLRNSQYLTPKNLQGKTIGMLNFVYQVYTNSIIDLIASFSLAILGAYFFFGWAVPQPTDISQLFTVVLILLITVLAFITWRISRMLFDWLLLKLTSGLRKNLKLNV